jgi:hypothetical protein
MPQRPQIGTPQKVPELTKIDSHQAIKGLWFPIIANLSSHSFQLLTRRTARFSLTKQAEIDIGVEMHNIMTSILVALRKNSLHDCVAANFCRCKADGMKPVKA